MSEQNIGTVVQIIGPVLDIKFAADALPKLLNAITIDNNGRTVTVEVAQHIGQDTVRCIAMESVSYTHLDVYKRQRFASAIEIRKKSMLHTKVTPKA